VGGGGCIYILVYYCVYFLACKLFFMVLFWVLSFWFMIGFLFGFNWFFCVGGVYLLLVVCGFFGVFLLLVFFGFFLGLGGGVEALFSRFCWVWCFVWFLFIVDLVVGFLFVGLYLRRFVVYACIVWLGLVEGCVFFCSYLWFVYVFLLYWGVLWW